ncbi:MAG: DNA mismatch repair protein MutS [Bacillota bacterium]
MTINKTDYTPMMQQYLTIKEDYNDAIVFFRLGDFYEMFFQDALLASRELEIQLTARDAGAKERVPMCGVPHHAADAYINRLIEKGYKVAIAEQTEDAGKGKKLVARDVVRVVTPGTNMDDADISETYIASVSFNEYFYTVSYGNISTGELATLKVPKDISALLNELSAIPLKEIVVSHQFDKSYIEGYTTQNNIIISIHNDTDIDSVFEKLLKNLPTKIEQTTTKRLLSYILKTQKRALLHMKPATHIEATRTLKMDANTIRHLELTKTMRQNQTTGSLFWLLNHTKTAMGARYLKKQLLKPLTNKEVLNTRYDFIEALNTEFIIKTELTDLLKNVYDLERIVGRIAYGNTNGKDLIQLRRSLAILPDFKNQLSSLNLTYSTFLSESIDALEAVHETLKNALLDEQPMTIKEGGMFKQGYNKDLDEIKNVHLNVKSFLRDFEKEEREKTGIKKLRIGYNRVFGYYIEIPKGQIDNIKDEYGYTRKQTLANQERYITDTLKEKEKIILSSEEKAVALEYDLFIALRDDIKSTIPIIQKNADIISEVDMLLALSQVSENARFIRPSLTDKHLIDIKDARHPVVESVLDDVFIANDIYLDESTDIALITGPNMSGKSTYMRQLAIIAVLAQIGSFVPASSATIPIFDQLFTRIGASDDLISGQSTFMVEMLDANHAIQNATQDSLILFDEIGRGTSTYDGLAIAQAMIEYIHKKIKCKTLFSTHYHELTDLEDTLPRLKNIHVAAIEEAGHITFLHQVKEGRADKSYGINVASLAHLPKTLISRSKTILKHLEATHHQKEHTLFTIQETDEVEETIKKEDPVYKTINALDLDALKPIEALNILYDLKKDAKNRK